MTDCMIDIETLGTNNDACILTVAAQIFDPLGHGYQEQFFYARVDIDSQPNRSIDQSTIDWWSKQPTQSVEEAFCPDDRLSLPTVLEKLRPLLWNSKRIWANGTTFDMNIIENAYKSLSMSLPWRYYCVRDARTIYSLYPDLRKTAASHHALEDCRRQILLLQETMKFLNIRNII